MKISFNQQFIAKLFGQQVVLSGASYLADNLGKNLP